MNKIKILHLYKDAMNLYGDYANVTVLVSHLKDMNLDVNIDEKSIGDDINFSEYNFVFMGAGTEENQELILMDIERYKNDIKEYVDSGKVLLFTGNASEILGQKIIKVNGESLACLGIGNFITTQIEERLTGDVMMKFDELDNLVIGYINKSTLTDITSNQLFTVDFGFGDSKSSKTEGVRINNAFGTQLIGPVLVRNYDFIHFIIDLIIKTSNVEADSYTTYQYEKLSYDTVKQELENRKQI